ncbi:hypothetical protein ARSEF4850_002934 [Beauveria asiatica]
MENKHSAEFVDKALEANCLPVPGLSDPKPASKLSFRLPSINEFDQGIEALREHGGQVPSWAPTTSPHPNTARCPAVHLPAFQIRGAPAAYSPQADSAQMTSSPYSHGGPFMRSHGGYASPPPCVKSRPNQSNCPTEEGDFFIYSFSDKGLGDSASNKISRSPTVGHN